MGTFRVNYRGVDKLLTSDFIREAMLAKAEKVKTRAEELAPFDPHSTDGTHYKEQFSVSSGVKDVDEGKAVNHHGRTRRAYGRVSNSDPAAFQIEHGTSDTPKHRTLGKALDALNE